MEEADRSTARGVSAGGELQGLSRVDVEPLASSQVLVLFPSPRYDVDKPIHVRYTRVSSGNNQTPYVLEGVGIEAELINLSIQFP